MRILKLISHVFALIPSALAYFLAFVVSSFYHATKEGWKDGS